MDERRPSGNGIKTPMNENAEFGVGVPLRKLMLVERFEGRFVVGRGLGAKTRRKQKTEEEKDGGSTRFTNGEEKHFNVS